MSRRTEKVGEMLRRELAQIIIGGELGDPRLKPTAMLSITAVRVSGDLGHARIFFDVLDDSMDKRKVAKGFKASSARIRHLLKDRVRMRRLPELHFEWDISIARGQQMEELFVELAAKREAAASEQE